MKNTIIISGFPGVGKSTLFKNKDFDMLSIIDSDSSNFSWLEPGLRHPEFPENYMEHIKSNIGKVDIILVSSHDVVRKALVKHGIPFTIVYPDKDCKEGYIKNYIARGNDRNFIEFISKNWDSFIDDIDSIDCGLISKTKLEQDQYLSSIFYETKEAVIAMKQTMFCHR